MLQPIAAMADKEAPRDKGGAGEEGGPLLVEVAQNPAEPRGVGAASETTMSEKNLRLRERKTTLIDQIALLEAVRGPRRRWTQDDDDKDDGLRVPRNLRQTKGLSTWKTRVYFVWIALALLLLVAVLTLQGTPQLCFQGYCLHYQPSPITAFRGGPRHDMAVMPVTAMDRGELTTAAEWVWSLGADGRLSRRRMAPGAEWDTYEATRFLGAPVVQRRESTVRLFAIEAGTGHLMVSAFFREDNLRPAGEEARHRAEAWDGGWAARPGAWGWHSLGGRFVYQPTLTEASTGHVEAYAVTEEGSLLRRVLAPGPAGGWGAWSVLGGPGFVGEVDVLVAYRGRGHLTKQVGVRAAALKDGQYQFAASDVSPQPWNGVWRPLGVPDSCRGGVALGWPILVAVGLTRSEYEYVVACGGGVWHKTYGPDGEWSGRWEALGTGPKGERLDTHGLTRGSRDDGGPAGLYARASVSGCVYHSTHLGRQETQYRRLRGSRWSHWRRVWCPEENLAVGNVSLAVDAAGAHAVALGEPGGAFFYSGVIDFHTSDPLQWQRHDRPQPPVLV